MMRPERTRGYGPRRIEVAFLGCRWAWERFCFGWRARWRLLRTETTYYDRGSQLWVTDVEQWNMRIPTEAATGAGVDKYAKLPTPMLKYPALCRFLVDRTYEGSSQKRDPGMVTVTVRGGGFSLTLKEPTARLKLTVELDDPAKLWEAVEAILGHDPVPWVADPYARPVVKMAPKGRG